MKLPLFVTTLTPFYFSFLLFFLLFSLMALSSLFILRVSSLTPLRWYYRWNSFFSFSFSSFCGSLALYFAAEIPFFLEKDWIDRIPPKISPVIRVSESGDSSKPQFHHGTEPFQENTVEWKLADDWFCKHLGKSNCTIFAIFCKSLKFDSGSSCTIDVPVFKWLIKSWKLRILKLLREINWLSCLKKSRKIKLLFFFNLKIKL